MEAYGLIPMRFQTSKKGNAISYPSHNPLPSREGRLFPLPSRERSRVRENNGQESHFFDCASVSLD
jgi:hypothetical protein